MNRATILVLISLTCAVDPAFGHSATVEDYYPKAKSYPLHACLVSDNKLPTSRSGYSFTHKNQKIRVCCKPCRREFKEHPQRYLPKLSERVRKASQ